MFWFYRKLYLTGGQLAPVNLNCLQTESGQEGTFSRTERFSKSCGDERISSRSRSSRAALSSLSSCGNSRDRRGGRNVSGFRLFSGFSILFCFNSFFLILNIFSHSLIILTLRSCAQVGQIFTTEGGRREEGGSPLQEERESTPDISSPLVT